MNDSECVRFLQWALPRLRMRWPGFRKVRRQVCKRLRRRLNEIEVSDVDAYRHFLEAHPKEWEALDTLCRVTISRFYRDRSVFDFLGETLMPALAHSAFTRGDRSIRVWSAGCASGEEPYTLGALWSLRIQVAVATRIIATDTDEQLLVRAMCATYPASSLRDVPGEWTGHVFIRKGADYCLRPEFRRGIDFLNQDIRHESPEGRFHLIVCRNLVFTYYDEDLQREILSRIMGSLVAGGTLLLGRHESLPDGNWPLEKLEGDLGFYRKRC